MAGDDQNSKPKELNIEEESDKMIPEAGTSPSSGLSGKVKAVIGVVVAVVLVIIGVVVYLLTAGSSKQCDLNDGFIKTSFNNVQMEYMFLKNKNSYKILNHADAKAACSKLSAELWEVTGGEPEWNHFYKIVADNELLKEFGTGLWINGEFTDDKCPGEAEQRTDCVKDKAENGNGLKVKWPSTGKIATYSRLSGFDPDDACMYLSHGKDVWTPKNCQDTYFTLCLRRQCNGEN